MNLSAHLRVAGLPLPTSASGRLYSNLFYWGAVGRDWKECRLRHIDDAFFGEIITRSGEMLEPLEVNIGSLLPNREIRGMLVSGATVVIVRSEHPDYMHGLQFHPRHRAAPATPPPWKSRQSEPSDDASSSSDHDQK